MNSDSVFQYQNPTCTPKIRLFCFPYAGGSAAIYHPWSDLIDNDVELCVIQLPGRGNLINQKPYTEWSIAVESIYADIQHYLDIPFVFFGHSMGGTLAFEVARLIQLRKKPGPSYIIFSGCRAPHIENYNSLIYHLPEEQFLERIQSFGGTPSELLNNEEILRIFLPILRADFKLVDEYIYTPGTPLPCSISAFGGVNDSKVSTQEIEAWEEHTKNSFNKFIFPGDHFFINTATKRIVYQINEILKSVISSN